MILINVSLVTSYKAWGHIGFEGKTYSTALYLSLNRV